jgi:hypothetical protein
MPRCLLSFVQARHTRIHEGRPVVPFSRLPLFSSPSHVRHSAPEQTDLVFRSWVVGRRSCCACDARTRRLAERARNVGRQSSWRRCCLGIALRQHSSVLAVSVLAVLLPFLVYLQGMHTLRSHRLINSKICGAGAASGRFPEPRALVGSRLRGFLLQSASNRRRP